MTEPAAAERPSEVTEVHTRLLRLALGIEESRAYWANVDTSLAPAQRNLAAFEQRWLGAKSLERVRTLLAYLAVRYDAYPEALAVLRRWTQMDPPTRQVICHWHLQLSDPMYRRFTGVFLPARRAGARATVDRDLVVRWVQEQERDRWAAATCIQFASKLLSAGSEAGLLSPHPDPRALPLPKVTDVSLAYLLHLLRGVSFAGTLLDNPYLASVGLGVGLGDAVLDQRLRALPGLTYHRMGHLNDLEWAAPTLAAWAEASL
jgi:hypothetical protein